MLAMQPTNVLVTGGAGYIGSHAAHQLVAAGYKVTVVDNLYSGHRWAVPKKAEFEQIDIGNFDKISALLRQNRISTVMHFAGHIEVPESISDPFKYYTNNVVSSWSLINACRQSGVNSFIFSSSAAVYGNPDTLPVTETATPRPINPYGRTKLIIEWLLNDLTNSDSAMQTMRHVSLRYFNVAGARHDGELGQSTPKASHLIKVACEAACGLRTSVPLYGTDYTTPDGTCIRDYIHVDDLAAAHVNALDYLVGGGTSCTLNCGYGRGFSVREVLDIVQTVSGKKLTIVESNRRAGDVAELVADSARIRDVLKWRPQYDDLEWICRTAFEWEQKIAEGMLGKNSNP